MLHIFPLIHTLYFNMCSLSFAQEGNQTEVVLHLTAAFGPAKYDIDSQLVNVSN